MTSDYKGMSWMDVDKADEKEAIEHILRVLGPGTIKDNKRATALKKRREQESRQLRFI